MTSSVYPLAFPKGTKLLCELCQKPAHKICEDCRVTHYCNDDHQKSDWNGIHEKICPALVLLRTPQPFLPSEEERKARDKMIFEKKMQLIEFTRSIAQRYLFEGNYERAIPGAMTSLKLAIEVKGANNVELVPSYLILGEANQGLGRFTKAQEYLSQAEWTVKKNPDCPLPIISKYHRNIAMLQMAKNEFEDALRNLANDIYNAAEHFGHESIHVSGGYFLMANIFFKQGKMDIADSLYRQVVKMWSNHLIEIVEDKTRISELDTILGKKDEEEESEVIDSATVEELASEAEARKVLYAIYELRRNENNVDLKELYTIRKCLSFIHFLSKENDKAIEFASILSNDSLLDEETKNQLTNMLKFINM